MKKSLWKLLIVLAISLTTGGVLGETGVQATECRFGGAEYGAGQVFHPRLEYQGTVFCVTCQCFQGGRTNCTSLACPVACTEHNSDCCRICAETPTSSTPLMPDYPVSSPTEVVACIHNGKIYKDGESFQSNNTLMKLSQPNQCVQCRCEDGMVLCEVHTCEQLSCQEYLTSPDNCCPICPSMSDIANSDLASPVTFSDHSAPKGRKDKDCISAGKYYMDGASWHPVIGPFGPMDCVMCHCNRGSIICSRFRCPSKQTLACVRPVKQFGQCCLTCPSIGLVKENSFEGDGPRQCVPRNLDLMVYRARGAGDLSQFTQYAFQKLGNAKTDVVLHSWVLHRGRIETFQTQTITMQDFKQLAVKFKFVILGASTSKHVIKFERREKKIKSRCTSDCAKKIERIEDNLNLQKISKRKRCQLTEMQILTL